MYMMTYSTREHYLFQISSDPHHIFYGVLVTDMNHILLDDRSRIKFGCYVVTGCSYYFNAAFEGTVVGAPARKGW
jgi:hypothetical protein